MKKLFPFALVSVALIGLSVKAESVSLSFGSETSLQFDYVRDEFRISTLATINTKINEGEEAKTNTIEIESSVKPSLCGEDHCYPTNQTGIGIALAIGEQKINATPIQSQHLSITTEPITAKLVIHDRLSSGNYPINVASLPVIKMGTQSLPLQLLPIQVNIKQRTCELSSKQHQHVQLRPVSVAVLAQEGEVFGEAFNISLSCDQNVNADVVFRDGNDAKNTGEYLTLVRPESTAQGVGIAIVRDDGKKVKFGETWRFSSNEILPSRTFSANYLKTGETLSAGSIKAIATISFSYH